MVELLDPFLGTEKLVDADGRPSDYLIRQWQRLLEIAQVSYKADAVIAHCGYAAKEAGRLFRPRNPIHVIPHGNFIDAFPNDVTRSEARGRLRP